MIDDPLARVGLPPVDVSHARAEQIRRAARRELRAAGPLERLWTALEPAFVGFGGVALLGWALAMVVAPPGPHAEQVSAAELAPGTRVALR